MAAPGENLRINPDRLWGSIHELAEIGPALKDVAAMNRELGMQAVYQNHSGADMVGAAAKDKPSTTQYCSINTAVRPSSGFKAGPDAAPTARNRR
mgnify:CR=1 FL=1